MSTIEKHVDQQMQNQASGIAQQQAQPQGWSGKIQGPKA
jgi:hypothetical protein